MARKNGGRFFVRNSNIQRDFVDIAISKDFIPKNSSIANTKIVISKDSLNLTRNVNNNKIKEIQKIFGF